MQWVRFTAALLVATLGAVSPAAASMGADEGEDPLAELLRREGIDELASPEADWAVRTLLRDDFVRSPTTAERVRNVLRSPAVEDLRHSLARELATEALTRPGVEDIDLEGVAYDIPMAEHPLVDTYIKLFTGRGRWYFERWLARADRYIPIMQPILESKGVPTDTVYLAMIESGFASHAYSHAAASGFWQFIASTGKHYGLRQDTWVDERRDFIKATQSAADYLIALEREFGDWQLAWAGYNAGGGRIRRALARTGAEDFWGLIDHRRTLAKETKHYVPKIIAAAIVAKNRERYGFAAVESLPPLEYDEVEVDGAVALRQVGKHLGVELEDLKTLNPALLYQITPPGRRYTLRVPKGRGDETRRWLASVPPTERTGFRQHTIRQGDTLWRIAERYNSKIAAIKEFNGIRNARYLRVGERLIIPTRAGRGPRPTGPRPKVASLRKASRVAAAPAPRNSRPKTRHKVAAGETLWSISQRYRVTVAQLRQWNRRRGNVIAVGEVLEIF